MPRKLLPYLCKNCGETDPENFRNRNKSECAKCNLLTNKEWRSKQGPDYNEKESRRKLSWVLNHPFQASAQAARARANKRKIPCSISGQYLERLYEEQNGLCYYTKEPMLVNSRCNVRSFSVDRVDSSKGYVPGNVVLCRSVINRMKNNLDVDDFRRWCTQVAMAAPQPSRP